MVYTFQALSKESENFFMEIQIDAGQNFLKLHETIQEALGFEKGQMTSFYLVDDEWKKESEITLVDMEMEDDSETGVMDKIKLKEKISEIGNKLLYVFDLFNERALQLELSDIQDGTVEEEVLVTVLQGKKPEQIDDSFLDLT